MGNIFCLNNNFTVMTAAIKISTFHYFRGQSSTGSTPGDIALTGDAQADADIMAFLKARQNIQNIGKRNVH